MAPHVHQPDTLDLSWDCYGTVYGRVAHTDANGQDGLVQQVASRTSYGGEWLVLLLVAVPGDLWRIELMTQSCFCAALCCLYVAAACIVCLRTSARLSSVTCTAVLDAASR